MRLSAASWIATAGLVALLLYLPSTCTEASLAGDECSGLARTLNEDSTLQVILLMLVIGLGTAGWWGLERWEYERQRAARVRPCPRCGRDVDVGVLDCPHCDFDFRTIGKD